ncbi:MAG TPA: hypothetical protein VNG71_10450 [Pyrinomonadaceae bacterium]|nr:hypothetical protein [Pyrinomonadaceae bacterium]
MLLRPDSEASTIRRMRVEATNLDPLAAQLRLSRLLSGAQFHPTVLPRSAILFVRKLSDPMPGVLDLETHDLRPPRAWQEALTNHLDQITAAAAYPARGVVANDSEAVVFLHPAELLSCLARDWLTSTLTTRWWWRSFLRNGGVPDIVTQLWRESPEHVPAALQHLSKQHLAATFVAKLNDGEVHKIVGSVASSFGLQALQRTLETRLPGLSLAATEIEFRSSVSARSDHNAVDAAARAPWLDRVPEIESRQLSLEQQRFLGIALMVQRAPAQARSRAFAQAVERWQDRVQDDQHDQDGVKAIALTHAEEQVGSRRKSSIDTRVVSSIQPEGNPARGHQQMADARPAVIHDGEETQSQIESFHEESSSTVAGSDRSPHDSIGTKVLLPTFDAARDIADVRESERDLANLEPPDPVESVSVDHSVEAASVEIETQLGGLFYLINLALYLNLYGDFTMPAAPGIELMIWDFVALAGAELTSDSLEEDPVWLLLANLAGREEEPPGASFAPDEEWRLPPEWLSMFSDDRPWPWSADRRRLRVLHPEGFLILDLPLANDVREQLQREIEPYDVSEYLLSRGRMPKLSPLRSKVAASPKVRRWLSRLMPYVRARLCLALGLKSQSDIAAMLCQRYARVRATDTHIDVFFRLADLPLEIRFAGLDRDPGWVPAAGRFITFHFD